MKITTLLLSVCFLFLSITKSNAQDLPSTLLWRIDGNGLQKPSYLYGTMHLTDNRIFDLGDSLFAAIENSEGLAIELDPKVFTGLVIDEAEHMIYNSYNIDKILSDKQLKKYGKSLAKKLGKNEENITTTDILREKNKRLAEGFKSDKMETFLDAYLFDAARRLGKWTGGVEDADDQRGLLNSLVDESDIMELALDKDNEDGAHNETPIGYEELVELYINQDLNGIMNIPLFKDGMNHERLLTIRNKKMVQRMDSLANQRSMVFAVGVAHLPGDDGLIQLLRQKGYTLTPVFSSKKIKASTYKLPALQMKWYPVSDKDSNYTISMPGEAEHLTLYGTMDMSVFYDVFNGTVYLTTALPFSSKQTADSTLNNLSKSYFHKKYKNGIPITINNIEGRAFEDTVSSKYSRGYLLYGKGILYMAVAVADKHSPANTGYIDKYLKSFSITETEHAPKSGNAYKFTDTIDAYSLLLSGAPTPFKNIPGLEDEKSTKTKLYSSSDLSNQTYFIFGTTKASPGYFIDDNNNTIKQLTYALKQKFETVETDTNYFRNGQHIVELAGITKESNFATKVNYYYRANRWYELLAVYEKSKKTASIDSFFQSFRMMDLPKTKWQYSTAPDSSFLTWSPGKIVPFSNEDEDTSTIQYIAFDTFNSTTYSILEKSFGKYYWQPNDSTLFEDIASWDTELTYMDSVISKKKIQNQGIKGIETLVHREGSSNYRRNRYLINNNKLYVLYTMLPENEVNSEQVNRFFENFKLKKVKPNDQIYKSKTKQLIADLSSSDSVQNALAYDYLPTGVFKKEDLPLVHQGLLNISDTGTSAERIKLALVNAILKIHDNTSLDFARKNYLTVTNTNRSSLLSIMLDYPSEDNFRKVAGLVTKQPPINEPDFRFIRQLTDSLSLTANVIDDFLPLLKIITTQDLMLPVVRQLADENLIHTDKIKPYTTELLNIGKKILDSLNVDSTNINYYATYNLVPILSWINTEESNNMLLGFAGIKHSDYLKLMAVNGLIRNERTVPSNVIKALAANVSTRLELYDTLTHYKKSDLFPVAYKTQLHFAESYVYYAASDDEEPLEVTFIEKKEFEFKGRKALFYFYKVRYNEEDEDESYLGCAGPFELDKKILHNDETQGDMLFDVYYNPETIKQQEKKLFEQIKTNILESQKITE